MYLPHKQSVLERWNVKLDTVNHSRFPSHSFSNTKGSMAGICWLVFQFRRIHTLCLLTCMLWMFPKINSQEVCRLIIKTSAIWYSVRLKHCLMEFVYLENQSHTWKQLLSHHEYSVDWRRMMYLQLTTKNISWTVYVACTSWCFSAWI